MPQTLRSRTLAILTALVAAGCADTPSAPARAPVSPGAAPAAAKGTAAAPSVSSVAPSFGARGTVGLDVTINGSGFGPSSTVAWALAGVPSDKVHVTSVRYVSGSQLVATISIDADAAVADYDVMVMVSGGKPGIGTELFTVTTAVAVSQLSEGFDINLAGQIAGMGGSSGTDAVFWDPATNTVTTLERDGKAFALDEAGATVAGRSAAGGPGMWVRLAGGAWTAVPLEMAGSDGRVFSLVSDASGHALRMAGSAWLGTTADTRRALMWTRTNDPWTGSSDTWRLQVNPTPGGGGAFAVGVNSRGMMVGTDGTTCCKAFFWNADGTGAVLPALSNGAASHAWAITEDGTMIVGASNNVAVAWRRTANADGSFGAWGKPVALEPTSQFCGRNGASEAHDVAPDGSVVVGSSCGTPMAWRIASPGATPVRTTLKGLGNPNNGWANAINANVTSPLAAGRANNTGVFWRRF